MNRIVVISGGSSGIGKELTEQFMNAGDIAVCLSRSNPSGHAHYIPCDVSELASIEAATDVLRERYGRVIFW